MERDEISVITRHAGSIWATNMSLANWKYSCIWSRPTAYLYIIWTQNMTLAKWWNTCNGARQLARKCSKFDLWQQIKFVYWWKTYRLFALVSKYNLCQVKKFGYFPSISSLSELSMGSKNDLRQMKVVNSRSTNNLCWILSRNITSGKWRNSCIVARPTDYEYLTSPQNMTRAK
jgi:hypothetical protein